MAPEGSVVLCPREQIYFASLHSRGHFYVIAKRQGFFTGFARDMFCDLQLVEWISWNKEKRALLEDNAR